MEKKSVKVLLIEDTAADARLVRELFSESRHVLFDLVWTDLLQKGLQCLETDSFDVILLDLHLPDSYGITTLGVVLAKAPTIPVVVLTSLDDEMRAVSAVQEGAQDYIVKGQVDGNLLARTLQYAIERKQIKVSLQKARDELEQRVKERTAALAKINQELMDEIAERKQVERALRQSEDRLRYLSSQLLTAHEEERKRVSREVHDVISSSLSTILLSQRNISNQLTKKNHKAVIESINRSISLTQEVIKETRKIINDLRPQMIDDLGLILALAWFTRQFTSIYSSISVRKQIEIEESELPMDLKIVIFRIVQEAFTNIGKYSQAQSATLSLEKKNNLIELCISDNGTGFDLEAILSKENPDRGLGLISMRERAELSGGSFVVKSDKGKGTTIQARWKITIEQ